MTLSSEDKQESEEQYRLAEITSREQSGWDDGLEREIILWFMVVEDPGSWVL